MPVPSLQPSQKYNLEASFFSVFWGQTRLHLSSDSLPILSSALNWRMEGLIKMQSPLSPESRCSTSGYTTHKISAQSQWDRSQEIYRSTHVTRVHADYTVAAPGTVHIAQGFHGNAAGPCVTLCHRTRGDERMRSRSCASQSSTDWEMSGRKCDRN